MAPGTLRLASSLIILFSSTAKLHHPNYKLDWSLYLTNWITSASGIYRSGILIQLIPKPIGMAHSKLLIGAHQSKMAAAIWLPLWTTDL